MTPVKAIKRPSGRQRGLRQGGGEGTPTSIRGTPAGIPCNTTQHPYLNQTLGREWGFIKTFFFKYLEVGEWENISLLAKDYVF